MLELVETYDPSTDDSHEPPLGAPVGWAPSTPSDMSRFFLTRRPDPATATGLPGLPAPGPRFDGFPQPAAPRPSTDDSSLPPLPAGLQLLCALAAPRSPVFHQLRLLLARASAQLAPHCGLGGQAGSSPGSAHQAPQVYRAAALAARLVELALQRERPLRDKLRRLRLAHAEAQAWSCWTADQAARLAQLHAQLWRSLPASGACALPQLLSEPLVLGPWGSQPALLAAPPRRSALGAAVLLLEAAAADAPVGDGLRLALACAGSLRAARDALGDRLASLLRAEGALTALRRTLELFLDPATEAALGVGDGGDADADCWEGELAQHLPPPRPPAAPPPPADAPAGRRHAPCHEPVAAARSPLCQLLLFLLEDLMRGAPPALAAAAPAPTVLELLGLAAARHQPRRATPSGGWLAASGPGSTGDASVLGRLLRLCGGGGGSGAAVDELVSELALRVCTHTAAAPAALRALHASGALPPLLRLAAPRLAAFAPELLQLAGARPAGPGRLAAGWGSAREECTSALHGAGFRLRLAAAALAGATRPAGDAPDSAAAEANAAGQMLDALLAPEDQAEQPGAQSGGAQPADAPPLCATAEVVALLSRALLGGPPPPLPGGGSGWVVREARGDGCVELLDAGAVAAALAPGQAGGALWAVVEHNERQHAAHALGHALRGLRDACVLLGRACGDDDYSAPRLAAATTALRLLPGLPPDAAPPLARPLCEAAAACLGGLGAAPLLPAAAHLQLLTLARAALDGAARPNRGAHAGRAPAPTGECRREVYSVILVLLRLALPPAGGGWAHPQQPVLAAQAAAALAAPPGGALLVKTVALDACDGPPLLRGAALALLAALLDAEGGTGGPPRPPLVQACLCRTSYLSDLLAPLSSDASPLNRALCALAAPPAFAEPHQDCLWEAWRFHAALALVTRLLTSLRASAVGHDAEPAALFDSLAATGALAHLPRASFLSLPLAYLADADEAALGGGAPAGGAEAAAAAHARVLYPLLRAVSAALLCGRACDGEAAHRHAAALAAEVVGADETRARTSARLLRAPLRLTPRSAGRRTALRTAAMVARLLAALAVSHPALLARAHGQLLLSAASRLVGPLAALLADAHAAAEHEAAAAGAHALSLRLDDGAGGGGAAAEAAAAGDALAALMAFVHAAARPPLGEALLFAPTLRESGPLAGPVPPAACLQPVLDVCAVMLAAAEERHAALEALGAALPAATAQRLRHEFAALADEAAAAGADPPPPPPPHFDQPQLARCTASLVSSAIAAVRERAALLLGCLEQALLLLHQHLDCWAADDGGLPPAQLRELRAVARRGPQAGRGGASALTAALAALLRLAPARVFERHEERLALVRALARKCLEMLT